MRTEADGPLAGSTFFDLLDPLYGRNCFALNGRSAGVGELFNGGNQLLA